MSNPNTGPLRARISTLTQIAEQIDDFRTALAGFPSIYRADILDELRALVAEYESPGGCPVTPPDPAPIDAPPAHTYNTRLSLNAIEPSGSLGVPALLSSVAASPQEAEEDEEAGATVRDRMKDYFYDNSNEAATVAELASGIKATRLAVQTILYKRNDGQFERAGVRNSGGAPAGLWRLTKEELEKLKTSEYVNK